MPVGKVRKLSAFLTITPEYGNQTPTTTTVRVYLGMVQLWTNYGCPEDGIVRFSTRQLASIIDRVRALATQTVRFSHGWMAFADHYRRSVSASCGTVHPHLGLVGDRKARSAAARQVRVERQVRMQTCRWCSEGFRLCSFPGLRRAWSSLLRKRLVSWSVLTTQPVDP